MDIFKSNGESSSRGQEDGDGATGSERPLKKARYAWQVKGKYHLKNETEESNKNLTRPSTGEPSTNSLGLSSTLANKMENYLIRQDYSKLDSVANSGSSLHAIISNSANEKQYYPTYISTYERTSNNVLRSNCCNNMKTVSMPDRAEDQCIAQWQAKQLRKGCLDNTLNRVLESWSTDPLPAEESNSRFLALDFAEFINHLPGDNSVENEGILMAISAHGLQNTPSSSSNDASYTDNCSISSAHAFDTPSPPQCLSPIVSDADSQDTNKECEINNKPSEIKDWQTHTQNADDSMPFAYFSEPPQSPYQFYHDNHQNSNTDSFDIDSQFDFMNAAVLYAIKSKGLTASVTEYG